jgi:hypothetical protein
LRRLEQVINGRGLKLFARFDHTDEAAAVGLSMPPAHVLVFGSPRAGTPSLAERYAIAPDLAKILAGVEGVLDAAICGPAAPVRVRCFGAREVWCGNRLLEISDRVRR